MSGQGYRGRFAPTPSGPLHEGSLASALASWLDARAHGGRWLLRIEDVDGPRCPPGAAEVILQQLQRCGLLADEPVLRQSGRGQAYAAALRRLEQAGQAYPCACTRSQIARASALQGQSHERHAEWVYPGTCRPESGGLAGRVGRAWRLHTGSPGRPLHWFDRRLGEQQQDVALEVGDFVLRRADGCWAYQLAVVVDDADQGITQVVRGEDLTDNTARQILLQQALGLPTLTYLHHPLLRAADGEKLSKSHGAPPVDLSDPVAALSRAAGALGLPLEQALGPGAGLADALATGVALWGQKWAPVA